MLLVSAGYPPAEPKLEQFFAQNCVKCHGPEKQKGKVRLDKPVGALFADEELLEIIAAVLEAGEMPPESAPQPTPQHGPKPCKLFRNKSSPSVRPILSSD